MHIFNHLKTNKCPGTNIDTQIFCLNIEVKRDAVCLWGCVCVCMCVCVCVGACVCACVWVCVYPDTEMLVLVKDLFYNCVCLRIVNRGLVSMCSSNISTET